jgi:hypothetical protein
MYERRTTLALCLVLMPGCYAAHMASLQRVELAPIASGDLECPKEELLFEELNTGLEKGWRVTGCGRTEGYVKHDEGWKRSDGSTATSPEGAEAPTSETEG